MNNVVVIGGGFTGVAAAIAAARQGMDVTLVEEHGFLGGAAGVNLVNPLMRYWTWTEKNGEKEKFLLSRGILLEIMDNLIELEKQECKIMIKDMLLTQFFHEEYLKIVLEDMALKEGVKLLYHTVLCDTEVEDNAVKSVTVISRGVKIKLEADCFIDATGDANLAAMCGCEFQLGREKDNLCQPMTLCFRLINVDLDEYKKEREGINPLYKQFKEKGLIENPREDVLIFENLMDGVLHFNSTRVVKLDPTNPYEVSQSEVIARKQIIELHKFLRENFKAFKDSQLMVSAPSIGTRESRKIKGEYVMTVEDIVNATKFSDSIAAGNYDIDIHNPEGTGTSHYRIPEGEWYTIPYRSLIPKGMKNLLVGGRCISATHEAQASVRIIPICCTTGEACGVAAAVMVKDNVKAQDADTSKIQKILEQTNCFF